MASLSWLCSQPSVFQHFLFQFSGSSCVSPACLMISSLPIDESLWAPPCHCHISLRAVSVSSHWSTAGIWKYNFCLTSHQLPSFLSYRLLLNVASSAFRHRNTNHIFNNYLVSVLSSSFPLNLICLTASTFFFPMILIVVCGPNYPLASILALLRSKILINDQVGNLVCLKWNFSGFVGW